MRVRSDHDLGFFLWAIPGLLTVFGAIAVLSIGFPFLVAGLALFAYLLARGPTWPADLGLVAGLGLGSLLFGTIATAGGDYSPSPWLQIGVALVGSSAGLFWWLRCRPART